jgi:hypothetical protein
MMAEALTMVAANRRPDAAAQQQIVTLKKVDFRTARYVLGHNSNSAENLFNIPSLPS